MKSLYIIIFTATLLLSVRTYAEEPKNPRPAIVPSPILMLMDSGYMPITETTQIIVPEKHLEPLAKIFANELKLVTG